MQSGSPFAGAGTVPDPAATDIPDVVFPVIAFFMKPPVEKRMPVRPRPV